MPELPEVEIIKNQLQKTLSGQPQLVCVQFSNKKLREPIPKNKLKKLIGEKLIKVERRAKYLIFVFESNQLISHLGMTGSWQKKRGPHLDKHEHALLQFSNRQSIVYADVRRFGYLGFDFNKKLSNLGVEPLEKNLTAEMVFQNTRKTHAPIKSWIMDQKNIVGIGNIYASEALFRAGVRPTKQSMSITLEQSHKLVTQIRSVLQEAISQGGSTIRDYRNAENQEGGFQSQHLVYGREGMPCVTCNTPIKKVTIAGRSSFYCHRCQQ